ncbi:ATP-binding protein [Brochothrix thermosphacta]|uniref:ATP-binding protein n=1 Tax=Brochothrix thermosphacta TaxID=2756 RepID=UPI003F9D2CA2
MGRNEELEEIIRELFYQNTEGEYWDFKEFPYFYEGQDKAEINKKKNDLLHDIICMANNLSNNEAYLIMGISDKPVEIIGVEKYLGRWTQENYLDFIQSKKWAGDYIPALELRTITNYGGAELDILVIHKSSKVPFYIKEKYKNVQPNQIYIRKGAKNTSINKQAEIQDIEKLWEFRFGLIPYPKERVFNYIKDTDSWIKMKSSYEGMSWYYDKFPEYTIEFYDDPENEDLKTPPFALMHTNARSSWHILKVKYHQTILLELSAHYIDETRGIAVHPKSAFLNLFARYPKSKYVNSYYYYFEDSPEINLMWLLKSLNSHDDDAWSKHLSMIPIFENVQQKETIEKMVNVNTEKYQGCVFENKEKCYTGYNNNLSDEDQKYAQIDMATTLMIKEVLEKYKVEHHYQ